MKQCKKLKVHILVVNLKESMSTDIILQFITIKRFSNKIVNSVTENTFTKYVTASFKECHFQLKSKRKGMVSTRIRVKPDNYFCTLTNPKEKTLAYGPSVQ